MLRGKTYKYESIAMQIFGRQLDLTVPFETVATPLLQYVRLTLVQF